MTLTSDSIENANVRPDSETNPSGGAEVLTSIPIQDYKGYSSRIANYQDHESSVVLSIIPIQDDKGSLLDMYNNQ